MYNDMVIVKPSPEEEETEKGNSYQNSYWESGPQSISNRTSCIIDVVGRYVTMSIFEVRIVTSCNVCNRRYVNTVTDVSNDLTK